MPEVAGYLNVDLAELRELNPALRAPVYRGQKYVPKGYRLRLPSRSGQDWQQLIAQLPQSIFRQKQKRSTIYTVQRGDTAGKIAKFHGVNLNELIAVNNLDRRATIYVNQRLRIPLPEDKSILVAKQTKTISRAASQPPPPSNSIPLNHEGEIIASGNPADKPALGSGVASPPVGGVSRITAAKADSADTVSQPETHRPQADQMAKFLLVNQTFATDWQPPKFAEETEIVRGSVTRQHQPKPILIDPPATQPAEPAGNVPRSHPQILQGHFAVRYLTQDRGKPIGFIRVEAEETLGHYADWLNVAASEIRRLNGFRYGRPLHLNQRIKIPLRRVSKEEFEEKRFEFHQELAEDFFATYRVDTVRTYHIKKGDNIWTLSRQEFEVPLWLIKRYTAEVDFGALIPSQKLLIPVVEKDA